MQLNFSHKIYGTKTFSLIKKKCRIAVKNLHMFLTKKTQTQSQSIGIYKQNMPQEGLNRTFHVEDLWHLIVLISMHWIFLSNCLKKYGLAATGFEPASPRQDSNLQFPTEAGTLPLRLVALYPWATRPLALFFGVRSSVLDFKNETWSSDVSLRRSALPVSYAALNSFHWS